MRYPPNIQKVEREKRQKKSEEIHDIESPLRIIRKMKPPISTKPKGLLESRESRLVERKGEVMSENSTKAPKDLFE